MKRGREKEAVLLDGSTSEQAILSVLAPLLRQLDTLTGIAMTKAPAGDRHGAGMQHSRALAMCIGFCVRMAFDCQMFAERDVFSYLPISAPAVMPACVSPYSVAVFACPSPSLAQVDVVNAVLKCEGHADVTVHPRHLFGNLFTVPIPNPTWLVDEKPVEATLELSCEGRVFAQPLTVKKRSAAQVVAQRPYSPEHLPLHFAALTGNVAAAILQLEEDEDEEAGSQLDECGISAAALALFFGKRVVFSLLLWKRHGWPVYAVCQLLRCRLELDSAMIEQEQFCSIRDAIHELIFNAGPSVKYRPVTYQTTVHKSTNRGPLAVMLLPEIPYTEHQEQRVSSKPNQHRRGSLDLLLRAIETFDGSKPRAM